jgi:hypothetical protein
MTMCEEVRYATLSGNLIARLGAGAFETISGEVVNVCLGVWTKTTPDPAHLISILDVDSARAVERKKRALRNDALARSEQRGQVENPQAKLIAEQVADLPLLSEPAIAPQGVKKLVMTNAGGGSSGNVAP